MKKIFEIFKTDIKNIFKNYAALIVVIALCILPSLYAWFNIKASWDPYSQDATSGIKIGVINKDIGTSMNGEDINIGDEVVTNLKENKQLGWQFVSEEEGKENLEKGTFYATIMLPENFSEDLTSILSDDVVKAEIIYTVNEKINAIAPKLTDKGATALQQQVTEELVETVGSAIFGVANDLGIELEAQIPKISSIYNSLVTIQNSFGSINTTVDKAYGGAEDIQSLISEIQTDIPKIKETITNAKDLSGNVQEFINSSQDTVGKLAPLVKQDIKIINEVSNTIGDSIEAVKNAISSGAENAPAMLQNLIDKVESIKASAESLVKILNSLNKFTPGKPLTPVIEQITEVNNFISSALDTLNDIEGKISNGINVDLTLFNNIISMANNISSITDGIYNSFDSTILPELNNVLSEAYTVAQGTIEILKAAEEKLPKVEDILDIAFESADKGVEGIALIKEKLPEAENMINNLVEKLDGISNEEDLMEVVNLLKADVEKRSDFLSAPVNIVENRLYPMGNYGSAMTPFYTVLSLWVGVLLLASIITVEKHGDYTATQVYFGKLLLFVGISIIQSLIVSLGDLYILKIYCSNPMLFVAGTIFTGITFSFIVYSLVSVFGNVGKVMAIILLVLQVAGAGGTFPIQLTPKFFQMINPYLPFTYSISFAREAIGGVVASVLQKDIIVSFIYIGISIVIALMLKKPLNKLFEGFVKNFKKSEIGE